MNRGRVWGSMVAVMILVLVFDVLSHMWGPGVYDWSTLHLTWNTVSSLQGWLRLVGLPLAAYLLYLERKGNPLGKYWVTYPFVRLLYDVGWMMYFHNPYPSWYVDDFGAFFLCMAPAFVIDSWGTRELREKSASEATKGASNSKVKLAIEIISLVTAVVGLIKSLLK